MDLSFSLDYVDYQARPTLKSLIKSLRGIRRRRFTDLGWCCLESLAGRIFDANYTKVLEISID